MLFHTPRIFQPLGAIVFPCKLPRRLPAFLAVCGSDFLRFIIASRRIFFNPVSAAPEHKSYLALRSPDSSAGSVQRLQLLQAPLAGLCAAPQRQGQLCEGESVGFSFGHGKGAACWPHLCFLCALILFGCNPIHKNFSGTNISFC